MVTELNVENSSKTVIEIYHSIITGLTYFNISSLRNSSISFSIIFPIHYFILHYIFHSPSKCLSNSYTMDDFHNLLFLLYDFYVFLS